MVNQKDTKKRLGIIGCGNRIKQILRLLLNNNPHTEIYAIYDIEKKAIEEFKKEFGENIKVYGNSKDLINDAHINWILIGSPNYAHKTQLIEAFNAGKNVFCEKPLAISIQELEKIKQIYEKNKPLFQISYPLRYSSHYIKLKEIIESGRIGNIISLEFNETLDFTHGSFIMSDWRRFNKHSGGHLLEKCCHDIDIANWITRSIPKKVASFGDLNFFKPESSYIFEKIIENKKELTFDNKLISNPFLTEKDIIDNQVAIIEYKNGVRATFHTNLSSAIPERRMYICGEKGTIRADIITGKIEIKFLDLTNEPIKIEDNENTEMHGGGDKFLVQALDKAIQTNSTPKTSIHDAIKSAVTCIAIDKARKTNSIIDMTPIWEKFGYN